MTVTIFIASAIIECEPHPFAMHAFLIVYSLSDFCTHESNDHGFQWWDCLTVRCESNGK